MKTNYPRVRNILTFSLFILIIFTLCACTSFKHGFYNTALDFERSRAGLEFETIDVHGKTIALLENKPEKHAATAVLLHGFGANKENWLHFAANLTETYHVICPDLPGHGQSIKDFNLHYDIDDQVRYLHEILGVLKINKFHLAGNSMGGAIASLYAATYPEEVTSLWLFDPGGIYKYKSELNRMLDQGKNPLIVQKEDDFEALMDFAMQQQPFLPWPITSVLAEKAMANRAINEKIFHDITNSHAYVFDAEIKKITSPTLILWGRQDRVLDVKNADEFEKLIPNSKKVILENVGHVPMIEVPDKSAKICMDFVSSIS